MTDTDWDVDYARSIAVLMVGRHAAKDRMVDAVNADFAADNFLLLANAHNGEVRFKLAPPFQHELWEVVLDTGREWYFRRGYYCRAGSEYVLSGRSLALLQERVGVPGRTAGLTR